MNLSNYSAEAAVDEIAANHGNTVELARHATALEGADWVVDRLAERGMRREVARGLLRRCGLMPKTPAASRPAVDRLVSALRRDLPKLTPLERAHVFDIHIAFEQEHPVEHAT